ncbi:hypothetical protein CH063_08360, partial [Colletotrichum higginsianum]
LEVSSGPRSTLFFSFHLHEACLLSSHNAKHGRAIRQARRQPSLVMERISEGEQQNLFAPQAPFSL